MHVGRFDNVTESDCGVLCGPLTFQNIRLLSKQKIKLPCHKSWLVIGDNFIGFSSLCDFLMEHFTPNCGHFGMFDVSKTFCTRRCVRLLFETLNIPKRLIYSARVCVVTFGWELVVSIPTPSIFGRFLVHAWG